MKEVNLIKAQVSPLPLDVKQHSNKTLSELQMLFQTTPTLKGAVTGVSKNGDIIFTTIHGKFSAPFIDSLHTLNKGDKLVLKVAPGNNPVLGRIMSINGTPLKGGKSVALNLIERTLPSAAPNARTSIENVDVNTQALQDTPIKAIINYLNLSHINKNSGLSKILMTATNGSSIEFKLVSSNASPSTYILEGMVLGSEEDAQTIKTPFGILTSNNGQNLPLGKKIQLEIKSVDNKPVDNTTALAKVEDFIFKLNSNSDLLKSLLNLSSFKDPQLVNSAPVIAGSVGNSLNASSAVISSNIIEQIIGGVTNIDNKSALANFLQSEEHLQDIMNHLNASTDDELTTKLNLMPAEKLAQLLKGNKASLQKTTLSSSRSDTLEVQDSQSDENEHLLLKTNTLIEKAQETPQAKEVLSKLAEDFNKLKELLNIVVREDDNNEWYNFFLPVYDGQKVTQSKVSIRKKPNQYIRFIVELLLEALGDLQLDGLIKLKAESNILENFDLAVRFKNPLNKEVQTQISEMYKFNQNISGLKGGLYFEQVEDFDSRIDLLKD